MSGGVMCGKCFVCSDPGKPAPTCQLSYCPGAAERDRGFKLLKQMAAREEACPGHVASAHDPKVCGRCGVHIDSFRPDDDERA